MPSPPSGPPESLPRPVRWLLWLYPASVREEFGDEILGALARWRRDRAGRQSAVRFWLRAALDLTVAGLRMRWRSVRRGSSHRPDIVHPSSPRRSFEAMFQDLRYALRALRSSPGFTATAILLLAVGIGANAAVFSLVSTFLLEPYPYAEPDRLITVHTSSERWGIDHGNLSLSDYLDLREADVGLEGVALYGFRSYNVASAEAAVWVPTARVSADFFDVLGLEPLLGRTFLPGEDGPGTDVVVIGEELWRGELGADPAIVGSELLLDGAPHRVVGVIPAGTGFPASRRMWKARLGGMDSEPRYRRVYRAVGRLQQGESLETVRPRLAALGERLQEIHPDTNEGMALVARTLREHRDGEVRPMLLTLEGAAAFLLLLVCANLASLLLARARSRHREVAIRAALGAGRGRITRQLLLESSLVAVAGGALGVAGGLQAVRALLALRPRPLPGWYTISLDWRVVAFTLVASLVAALACGLLPALRVSRRDVQEVLRASDRGASVSRRERRLLSGLIVAEVALSVVLLVGAGLMLSSFRNLTSVDPGFELEDRLTLAVSPPPASYDLEASARFVRELEQAVEALPGVRAVGSTALVPLLGTGTTGVIAEGQTEEEASGNPSVQFSPVTPGFFEAMGMELLRGRAFSDADGPDATPAVIVSSGMARRLWPDEDPVGRRLRLNSGGSWKTVVGVVNDVRHAGLTGPIEPQMYLPHAQDPWRGMSLVVHAEGELLGLVPAIRETIRGLDPTIAPYNIVDLRQLYDMHSFESRFSALLLWVFAAAAAVLAAVGLYAILAFGVARRTREIGIRRALGAARPELVAMVARQAGTLVVAGLAAGLLLAFLLAGVLGSQLHGVDPHDPVTYLLVAALMGGVAALATVLPARRAARLDPVAALREDP